MTIQEIREFIKKLGGTMVVLGKEEVPNELLLKENEVFALRYDFDRPIQLSLEMVLQVRDILKEEGEICFFKLDKGEKNVERTV